MCAAQIRGRSCLRWVNLGPSTPSAPMSALPAIADMPNWEVTNAATDLGCGWVGRYVMRRLIEQHGHDGMPQARPSSQETRRSMMPIMKTTAFAVAGIVFLFGVAPTGSQERQGVISHPPLLKM